MANQAQCAISIKSDQMLKNRKIINVFVSWWKKGKEISEWSRLIGRPGQSINRCNQLPNENWKRQSLGCFFIRNSFFSFFFLSMQAKITLICISAGMHRPIQAVPITYSLNYATLATRQFANHLHKSIHGLLMSYAATNERRLRIRGVASHSPQPPLSKWTRPTGAGLVRAGGRGLLESRKRTNERHALPQDVANWQSCERRHTQTTN